MSPDQDNEVLTLALEELNLNNMRQLDKYSRHAAGYHVGTGRFMSDLASMLAIASLRSMKPIIHHAVEVDFAEVERRVLQRVQDLEDVPIGFGPYTLRDIKCRYMEPVEVAELKPKKEPKHYEKFNKKRRGGRW